MKIASNKVNDIINFFHSELAGIYDKGETDTFIRYCFEVFAGMNSAALLINKNNTVSESELLKFNFAVKDLKKQKPIQYILGETYFYGLRFKVNTSVLIPRPETEELVDLIINQNKNSKNILDIGTGSGCIGIALKKHLASSTVYAVDISEEALNTAKQNAVLNNADVKFYKYDVLNAIPFPGKENKFDIIVSNPPYIELFEKDQMTKNVIDYEPHLALFVPDKKPLLFYEAITKFALNNLNNEGKLYFEINQRQGLEVVKMLEENGFKGIELIKDLNNNDRIVTATYWKK